MIRRPNARSLHPQIPPLPHVHTEHRTQRLPRLHPLVSPTRPSPRMHRGADSVEGTSRGARRQAASPRPRPRPFAALSQDPPSSPPSAFRPGRRPNRRRVPANHRRLHGRRHGLLRSWSKRNLAVRPLATGPHPLGQPSKSRIARFHRQPDRTCVVSSLSRMLFQSRWRSVRRGHWLAPGWTGFCLPGPSNHCGVPLYMVMGISPSASEHLKEKEGNRCVVIRCFVLRLCQPRHVDPSRVKEPQSVTSHSLPADSGSRQ